MKGKGNDEETKGAAAEVAAQEDGTDDEAGQEAPAIDYAAELASRDATIAERDGRITELEGQLAEAGKVGEENAALKSENEQLKNQAASERIDFALQLAHNAREIMIPKISVSGLGDCTRASKAKRPKPAVRQVGT